jgi:hypothetical protein
MQLLTRLLLIALLSLHGVAPAAPASASQWVQNHVPTELWSGPDAGGVSFGLAPQWDYFEVLAAYPQGRLHVLAARTKNFAFVDSGAVGPSGPPPADWPTSPLASSSLANPAPVPGAPAIAPLPGYAILAERALWPALQVLFNIQHTWTLQALSSTGTRLEWGLLPPEAAGAYDPGRSLVTINARWYRGDARALAAVIEHEAKHVADLLAGLDITTPSGCITTEINAFREEAKTWGKLVGPGGKADPTDELEQSLNFKLTVLQRRSDNIPSLIQQNPGYRSQCQIR